MRYHRVYTGRKLNVHRTCLNVLCSFNLRPVSTGRYTVIQFVAAVPLKKYLLNSKKKKKKIQILFFFSVLYSGDIAALLTFTLSEC